MTDYDNNINACRNVYFYWLGNLMGANGDYYPNKTYWDLFHKLFEIEFYWTIERDSNRSSDGLALRSMWLKEEEDLGHDGIIADFGPCSVLEMMAGIAYRLEKEVMQDPNRGDRTKFWFWTMIHNLGFDEYDDSSMSYDILDKIYVTIHNILDRAYDEYGTGSFFPVKKPDEDMRTVEIWYQMMKFLDENKDRFF